MVEWLAGNRIRGTSTERTVGTPEVPAISGGWKELGRATLGSGNSNIDVTSISDKRYYMVLCSTTGAQGSDNVHFRCGNGSFDSGTNYAYRYTENGAADSTSTSVNHIIGGRTQLPTFTTYYIANKSDKEKLWMGHNVYQNTAGAGTAPNRWEYSSKWDNVSNVINQIRATTTVASQFSTGSEVVVLGYDPSDTHTTNFWEELADVTLSSAGDNLSSGTINAKKYLWVQAFMKNTGGNTRLQMSFNNDTGNNIAERGSSNGGTDWTATSASKTNPMSATTDNIFINYFIINNSSNEKLGTGHIVRGSGGAGTAPSRVENVFKWANTSSQITEIDIDNDQAGSFDTGSFIKVWGSN